MKTLLSLRVLLVLKLASLVKTIVLGLTPQKKPKNQSAILKRSYTRKKLRMTNFYQPNREFS